VVTVGADAEGVAGVGCGVPGKCVSYMRANHWTKRMVIVIFFDWVGFCLFI